MQSEPSPTLASPGFPPSTPVSFRELYESHFAFTWRSLRYLGVPDPQLDDAVQDLWIAVYRCLPDYQGRGDIKTWLFGVAINIQRNLHRTNQRRAALVPLPSTLKSPVGDPVLEREGQEAWTLVQSSWPPSTTSAARSRHCWFLG